MNYQELNKNQKTKMNSICNQKYVMEWVDGEFLDLLLGKLPKVRNTNARNGNSLKELPLLEKELLNYDALFTDKVAFVEKISKYVDAIKEQEKAWNGLNLYEIKCCIKMHKFCLISGEGGVGKSFFIKCVEEQLEKKEIPHLCIYGKFQKNTENIDVDEIIRASEKGFVFIVDAINEMSKDGQICLLEIIRQLKKYSTIRIILSYRTNSLEPSILNDYLAISEYQYKFPGVTFESALGEILKLPVPDVYIYEDILYSNNALLLGMLCDILSSGKIVDETENGISSITFILEQYIKKNRIIAPRGLAQSQGVNTWKDTKRIASWMYHHNQKYIDEQNLYSTIKTGDTYLALMTQAGFLDWYENDNKKYYYFAIDTLTDYLIARSLFDDICHKDYEYQVRIIKNKVSHLNDLREALIIAIFDSMSPDYRTIRRMLADTELLQSLSIDTLVKVHFRKEDISGFLKEFIQQSFQGVIGTMGGYTNKPYNCSNFLFKYYCKDKSKTADLSRELEGYYFQNQTKNHIKNVLYFTALNDRPDRRDEESLYFSLLCSAAPNKDIRCLSMKLLYEVVSKNEILVEKVIDEYDNVFDYYIKEAIIYVLSQLEKGQERIVAFFNRLVKNEELTAKSIRRISFYLGDKYDYIYWDRKNLFSYKEGAEISDFINDILIYVDLMNKDFLPFRYWGRNSIELHGRFLRNDKCVIAKVNNYLREKYNCVCGGDCCGLSAFENWVMPEILKITRIETVDIPSFFCSFEPILKEVFEYYDIDMEQKPTHMSEFDFHNSTFMKCIDIAIGLFYGSMMCNYYTEVFATYNNYQNNIGYEVYDPLQYGEDTLITAPIPTYQELIEHLGDLTLSLLETSAPRDIHWVRDINLTRRNICHLLEVIEYHQQEWVLLAGRVSLRDEWGDNEQWIDTYDIWCCCSTEESIFDDGNARYLTIELDEYAGELKFYPRNTDKPWLCKRVKNISAGSDVFEVASLVLPPSEIISSLNLHLNVSDLTWENQENEKIIVCNNNKNSFYVDPIGSTVFIKREYLNKYLEKHSLKYFAFSERFIPLTGYADETSMHFEIIDGKIEKEIKNNVNHGSWNKGVGTKCIDCPHKRIWKKKNKKVSPVDLGELLGLYGN